MNKILKELIEELIEKVSLTVGGPHSEAIFSSDEVIELVKEAIKEVTQDDRKPSIS